jgi:hypothetical protein
MQLIKEVVQVRPIVQDLFLCSCLHTAFTLANNCLNILVETLPFGAWKVREAVEEGHGERLQEYFYESFKRMDDRVKKLSAMTRGRVNSSVLIYNFDGFTFWQVLSFKSKCELP